MKNKKLADLKDIIKTCVKCGACQAHCPVYQEMKREGDVARGKIVLAASLIDGSVALEERLEHDISLCLMCGSCTAKCPNKVATSEIVGAVRREVSGNKGLSFVGKATKNVLGSKVLMGSLSKSGALLSPLFFKKVDKKSGLRLRFPLSSMGKRTIPKLPVRNLFDRLPEFTKGDADKPVVGFFSGCSISYVYPKIGLSMVELLKKMGYSIHFPHSQKCCGLPALSSGDGESVEELGENNVGCFGKYDEEYIITACGSCNEAIGEYYATMGDCEDFTSKVIDFSVFLEKQGLIEQFSGMSPWTERKKVTYHDPCHLKSQNIVKEPRTLLKALPNIDYVEMDGSSLCCGLGGTFSVHHYECSKEIGAKKIPGLVESGAEIVATSCPGCIMQLQDTINYAGLPIQAVHILDLINPLITEENVK